MLLTSDARKAVEVIRGLGGRPLLVGGCIRDHFLGIESKDIDIEVHGPVEPKKLQWELAQVGRVDVVGMSFGVLKFGRDVDISFPRRDSKTGDGHNGFTIQVDSTMTVEEALGRRDFTINSVAMDASTGVIIDPFGGLDDLRDRVLRHTSEAFSDDPLRVLRAVQFSSRLGMSIADETLTLCRELAPRLSELSKERIWVEWEKILTKGVSMDRVGDAVDQIGLLGMFPGWDREHTWFVDEMLKNIPDIKGERRAQMILGQQFLGRGELLEEFLVAIDAPIWLRKGSRKLVSHPKVGWPEGTGHFVRAAARLLAPVSLRDWLTVRGTMSPHRTWVTAEALGVLDAPKTPLLTGDHLKALGLTPGPVFGEILRAAVDAQDRRGWETVEEALAWFDKRANHWAGFA